MKPLRIRRATDTDVDAIVRMVNAGGPDGKPRTQLPEVLPQGYQDAFNVIEADPHQNLVVAEIDGTVVGTLHLTFITYLAGAGRPDAQIEAVHVIESCRGQGIGTQLLQWAIQTAKDKQCRRVQLTSDKKRTLAHPLYLRHGFVFSHEGAKLDLTKS